MLGPAARHDALSCAPTKAWVLAQPLLLTQAWRDDAACSAVAHLEGPYAGPCTCYSCCMSWHQREVLRHARPCDPRLQRMHVSEQPSKT